MNTIIYWIVGIVIAFLISLLFEDARDFLSDIISMIWEFISDGFLYFISFEWLGDFWEFVCEMFGSLDEFSIGGLIFAVMSFLFIFLTRNMMLNQFTQFMDGASKIIWTVLTYVSAIIVGYLIGKVMFDN